MWMLLSPNKVFRVEPGPCQMTSSPAVVPGDCLSVYTVYTTYVSVWGPKKTGGPKKKHTAARGLAGRWFHTKLSLYDAEIHSVATGNFLPVRLFIERKATGGGPPAALFWTDDQPSLDGHQRDEKQPGIYNHHCCDSKIQQVLCFDGHWAKNSSVLPMRSCTKMSVLALCSSNIHMYIYIWVSATRKELLPACDCVKHLTFQIKTRQTEQQAETTSQLHLFHFFKESAMLAKKSATKRQNLARLVPNIQRYWTHSLTEMQQMLYELSPYFTI